MAMSQVAPFWAAAISTVAMDITDEVKALAAQKLNDWFGGSS